MTAQGNESRFADQLERLRTQWPQAWISDKANGQGEYLVCCPTWHLPKGWNKNICSVLWLAHLFPAADGTTRVISCLNGFYVDLDDLRLANGQMAHYSRPYWSRETGRKHYVFQAQTFEGESIPGFSHWTDVMRFWWRSQGWDPNRGNLYTQAMQIRQRLEMAR